MFYEAEHSLDARFFHVAEGSDFNFPLHLHESFEFITVSEGEMDVQVGNATYRLHPGSAVLVFPDQIHSLSTPVHSKHRLLIFSPNLIHSYAAIYGKFIPQTNLFAPPPDLLHSVFALRSDDSLLRIKGILYSIAASFDDVAEYREREREENDLLMRIFSYVGQHFSGKCTLQTLSDTLSYHYVYLSRYFKERTGISFTEYVNRFRINESCYRLTDTRDSITQIALECGFESLRSFHRNFFRQMSETPAEYRTRLRKTKK